MLCHLHDRITTFHANTSHADDAAHVTVPIIRLKHKLKICLCCALHLYSAAFLHGRASRLQKLSAPGQDCTQMERAPRNVFESSNSRGSR